RADYVFYLPLDTPANARRLIDILQPDWACFVKYDLWLNHLNALFAHTIPTILISARFDADSPFVKSLLAPLYRKTFASLTHIFTQDDQTKDILARFSPKSHSTQVSDTRYDRVSSNANDFVAIPEIDAFKGKRLCLMGGSTWPQGEKLLFAAWDQLKEQHDICLILAPHQIEPARMQQWIRQYPAESLLFSQIDQLTAQHRILWIDNIGMLSRLYGYADVTYVGGAWGSGLHNILEAAVFGCPVLFGPQHKKFPEAGEMILAGGAFSFSSLDALRETLAKLLNSAELRHSIGRMNKQFVAERSGATEKILRWCKDNALLSPIDATDKPTKA
ncbi:MAG: glycosyltransferase N-terminal domain-containing protein, partial [Bacteroidota bacterium]